MAAKSGFKNVYTCQNLTARARQECLGHLPCSRSSHHDCHINVQPSAKKEACEKILDSNFKGNSTAKRRGQLHANQTRSQQPSINTPCLKSTKESRLSRFIGRNRSTTSMEQLLPLLKKCIPAVMGLDLRPASCHRLYHPCN